MGAHVCAHIVARDEVPPPPSWANAERWRTWFRQRVSLGLTGPRLRDRESESMCCRMLGKVPDVSAWVFLTNRLRIHNLSAICALFADRFAQSRVSPQATCLPTARAASAEPDLVACRPAPR